MRAATGAVRLRNDTLQGVQYKPEAGRPGGRPLRAVYR